MAPAVRSDRSALVAVPLLLFVLDEASRATRGSSTEYLLVPPLAVMTYLLFAEPAHTDARLRAVVVVPLLAAIFGEVGYLLLGATPFAVAAVALAVLLAQLALGARMPPALAIAVLAVFLRVHGPWYALDVALASTVVWLAALAWRRSRRRAGHA